MRVKMGADDDSKRLIVELSSIYIACDDCGHSRNLGIDNLKRAAHLGVQSYRELCRKLRCGECPRSPPHARNLTIRPLWRCDEVVQTVA